MFSPNARMRLLKQTSWSGFAYIAFLLVGIWPLSRFFPSQPPSWSPQQIAQYYADHHTGVLIGMWLVLLGSTLYVPWTAILARLVEKVEGKPGILTYSQLMAGACNTLLTAYPAGYWLLAAFRPDRDPSEIQLINDISWTQFLGVITPFYFVPITIAYAALADDGPDPLIPRWVGWYNIFFELSLLPLTIIFWFHRGPFAWNGIFGFYLPFTLFFIWFFVMTWTVRRALPRLDV